MVKNDSNTKQKQCIHVLDDGFIKHHSNWPNLLGAMPGLFVVVDADEQVKAFNEQFAKYVTTSLGLINHTHWWSSLHFQRWFQAWDIKQFKGHVETIIVDGKSKKYTMYTQKIIDDQGVLMGCLLYGLPLGMAECRLQRHHLQIQSLLESQSLQQVDNQHKPMALYCDAMAKSLFNQDISASSTDDKIFLLIRHLIQVIASSPHAIAFESSDRQTMWHHHELYAIHQQALKQSHLPEDASLAQAVGLDESNRLVMTNDQGHQQGIVQYHRPEKRESSAKGIKSDKHLKAQSDMIMGMAHDVRTPFTGIMTTAQLLYAEEKVQIKKQRLLDIISSANLLMSMLEHLFSSIDPRRSNQEDQAKVFSVQVLLDELQALLLPLVSSNDRLTMKMLFHHDHDIICKGGADYLSRILMNIVSNAIKYTDAGRVTVSAKISSLRDQQGILHFVVADTGIGIPKEKEDQVFESFTRSDDAYSAGYDGQGFGLGIVNRLVKMMNGYITLRSQHGQGTRVDVWFPLTILSQGKKIQKNKTRSPNLKIGVPTSKIRTMKLRVLLVEDDPIAAHAGMGLMQHFGCEVQLSSSGKMTNQFIRKDKYDIIFMDVYLPDADGFQLARVIKRALPDQILYMLTACDLDEFQEKVIKYGMSGYYVKPLTMPLG